MPDLTPTPIVERCEPCHGMGGFSRGTAFDCCDRCSGTGQRQCFLCPVQLMGQPCAEHVLQAVTRFEDRTTTYACLNGHRWEWRWTSREWTRLEDVAAAEAVAS